MNRAHYLRDWIEDISNDMQDNFDREEDIVEHIQRHAVEDLNRYLNEGGDLTKWAASMRNLMDIFEEYQGLTVTVEDQLERLQAHASRYPSSVQAPVANTQRNPVGRPAAYR